MKLNKRMLIIISIVIAIIMLFIIVFISQKNNIQKVIENLNKEEETIIDGITCKVYDNQTEKLKSLIIISRTNGIYEVEYTNNDGKNIKLSCNNKQKLGIDLEIEVNKEYTFKVISNDGEEKIEKIQLDENYIKDYIKIIKLEDKEDISYNEVNIEYNFLEEGKIAQYKIEGGEWRNYTNTLNIDLEYLNIQKALNKETGTTVYARTVDNAGNIVENSTNIDITKIKTGQNYNVFSSMNKVGQYNLGMYGFARTTWSNIESDWSWYSVGNIGGGHHTGDRSYSMIVTLDCYNKKIPFKTIELLFIFYVERYGGSYTQGGITVNYLDGTSSSNNTTSDYGTDPFGSTSQHTLQQDIDTDKEVKNIQLRIWGYDGGSSSSHGSIRQIILKELQ